MRRFSAFTCGLALLAALASCGKRDGDDDSGPAPTPSPPAPNAPITYTAIGASDAVGVGASVPCLPFDQCTSGTGYVPVVARQLRNDGHTVTLRNYGLPGAVISSSFQQLASGIGISIEANFIDQEAPFVPTDPAIVTVFAGGNDANTIGSAVDRGAAGGDPNGFIDRQIQTFASDYRTLIRTIKGRAPSARIVVFNLPNLAGLPYLSNRTRQQRLWMQRAAVGLSAGANAMTSEGAFVVDLMCDARSYQASNYSGDGFHPDDSGYAYIAGEALKAIAATSWPAPAGSCAHMTIVN
jgi:lysophospholipase L1-like esterase